MCIVQCSFYRDSRKQTKIAQCLLKLCCVLLTSLNARPSRYVDNVIILDLLPWNFLFWTNIFLGMMKAKKKEAEVEKLIKLSIAPRGKKKAVTVVQGLKTFGIDLKVASKFFAQKESS